MSLLRGSINRRLWASSPITPLLGAGPLSIGPGQPQQRLRRSLGTRPATAPASASYASSSSSLKKPFVKIVEVSPRDGLQNEPNLVPLETKIELIKWLQLAGAKCIEVGSMVSPKWVPQMEGTADVWRGIREERSKDVSYPVLVPNARGLDNFLTLLAETEQDNRKQQPGEIAVFTAATDSFSLKNTNVSIADSLARLAPVCAKALDKGLKVRGYVSVVAGCPFDGSVDPRRVREISEELFQMGCYEVSLGDTTGVGEPKGMVELVDECVRGSGKGRSVGSFAIHAHDTYKRGLANVLATVQHCGIRTVDASVGGLGGCPYSPGSSGNIDTESVVWALEASDYRTGIDMDEIIAIGNWIRWKLGKAPGSPEMERGARPRNPWKEEKERQQKKNKKARL